MKKLYLTLASVVLFGVTTSCQNYLDVNTDPTRFSKPSLATALTGAEQFVSTAHYNIARTTCLYTQQQAAASASSGDATREVFQPDGINDGWTAIYLNALSNLDRLIQFAQQEGSPHYVGVAKVLQAVALGLATDTWEDVPFSQAFKGSTNLTPDYDRQEQIYQTVQTLLSEALTNLQSTSSKTSPGADDIMYKGDRSKWIRLANTLKARYALHLTAKGATQAANNALGFLNAAGGTLTNNADDLQLDYALAGGKTPNPWGGVANETIVGRVFTISFSTFMIQQLQNDPRLPLIAQTTAGVTTGLVGTAPGTAFSGGVIAGNAYLTQKTWHSRANESPLLVVTYSEAMFIRAEARFLAAGGTETSTGAPADAYADFLAGIRANMLKVGVTTADVDKYIATLPTAANLKLSTILLEKYKALFLQPEVWVDMRRYAYSTNVYTGLALPMGLNPDAAGKWIQRPFYPNSELSRNAQNVNKYVKQFTAPMWRDSR